MMMAGPDNVQPVGPMEIQAPAQQVVTTTTTTTGGDGISVAINDDGAFDDDNMTATASVGGLSVSAGPNGAYASAGDVSASAGTVNATVSFGDTATTQTTQVTTTTVSAPVTCGLSLDAHASLLNTIRQAPVGDEVDIVKSVASSNYITVDQAVAVIKVVRNKYSLGVDDSAVAMYPAVCDPGNWFKVYNNDVVDALSADNIRKRVSQMPTPRGFH